MATNTFSVVVLPDTQIYAESFPAIYQAQTAWIKTNQTSRNIKCVLHVGDIVNNDDASEWNNALAAHTVLDGFIPYVMALGNHDYSGGSYGSGTLFNDCSYFGPGSAYAAQPNIAFHEPDRTDTAYLTFSAGSSLWLAMGLPLGAPAEVLTWADAIVSNHPNHGVLVAFHDYLDQTGQARTGGGQQLWDNVLKKHGNVMMVFCGHAITDLGSYLASQGNMSNTVYQMLSNYQHLANGGDGWMRILDISTDGTVDVTTYSPTRDEYRTDAQHQFSFVVTNPVTPKVSILRPLQNTDMPTPFSSRVEIFVDMTQVTGSVQQVELFDGMSGIGVDTTAPYEITWNEPRTNREVFLHAVMTDGSGMTTSSVVRVTTWMLDHDSQVSMLTDHTVRLSGSVTGDGSALATFFYGTSDGGTDQGAWESRVDAGQVGQGSFSVDVYDLARDVTYYYRAYATNNVGDTWSGPGSSFTTPIYDQWDRRMDITFSGYSDTETLTNFPALVVLSTNIAGFAYSQFGSPGGEDLRFTDGGGATPLSYEIEQWDPVGQSHVWVQVPAISGPGDFISAYWGRNATVPPPYTQDGSTWSEGYELVLHLNGNVSDSVSNLTTVIDQNSTDTTGIVGRARDFDSTTSSYLEPLIDTNWYGAHITNLTISIWGRPDSTQPKSPFGVFGAASDSICVKPSRSSWSYRVADKSKLGSGIQAAQWQMLGIVLDSHTALGYQNDTQHNIGIYSDFIPADRIRFGDTKGDNQYFDGILDEARISQVARSPAWMRASYLTVVQNQAFTSYQIVSNMPSCPYSVEYCDFIGRYPVADNDPTVDSDGDGATNYEEYIAGTDPNDPQDVFQVLAIDMLDGSNCIRWMSGTNSGVTTEFVLSRMTNLVDFVFEEIANGIARDASGTNLFYDTSPPDAATYYRPALPTNEP